MRARTAAHARTKVTSGPLTCPNQGASPQPRRSDSQAQTTSPCQRWASRMCGEVGGHGVVGVPQEVAADQGQHAVDVIGRYVAQQPPLGDDVLHVETVAAGSDQHEQGVEPGGTDRRPVPVAEQGPAVGGEQHVVVADVGVHERLAGDCLGELRGERRCLVGVREVTSGPHVVPVRRPVGEVGGHRVEVELLRRRRQHVGDRLQRVQTAVELGPLPRPAGRLRLDVLQAEHHPVAVHLPQQARRRGSLGQGPELARLLAVRRREHLLGHRRRGLHEVP